jgi:hypothetical protein
MKNLSTLLILLFTIISCSKDDPLDQVPTNIKVEGYDSEWISDFADREFEVGVKYTLLDTIYTKNIIGFNVHALITDDDSLTFKWIFDNKPIPNPSYFKLWRSEKWAKGSGVSVDVSKLSGTFPVSVDIRFNKDGSIKKRSAKAIIKHKFEKFDIFDYDYGMSRSQVLEILRNVKKIEGMKINEVSPTAINADIDGFGKWDGGLQFKFNDNKLVAISELGFFIQDQQASEPYVFNKILERFGSSKIFKEVYNPTTKKNEPSPALPYSWTHNGIKFTVDYKDFEVSLNKSMKFRALTYEKLN